MRVLGLDCRLGVGEDNWSFSSSLSLFDYDAVFWRPDRSLTHYQTFATTYQNLPSLSEHRSAQLVGDATRRRAEFKEFLEMGRTLTVFLPGDTRVYVDTGKREYSGTGRNRATTQIVAEYNILKAIPMSLKVSPGSGLEIVPANDAFASLLRQTKGAWGYRCLIEPQDIIRPLLYVRGTKKMIGGMVRVAKGGGILLLLPDLFLPVDEEDEYDTEDLDEAPDLEEEDDEDDEPGANNSIENLAEAAGATSTTVTPAHLLLDWINSLLGEPDSELPGWAAEYRFQTEVDRGVQLKSLNAQMSELQTRIDSLNAAQARDEQWKSLVAASGTALERRVQEAFEAIGFQIQETLPGRSDLRGTYDSRLIVVEVKGLTKSAAEKHAAQLEKWVSQELADGREAKGILVVNTWKDLPLDRRTEANFPDQMLRYSRQRGHCLLTGLQLLAMARACLDDPERRGAIASLILDTVGPIENWSDLATIFLSPQPQVEAPTKSSPEPAGVEAQAVETGAKASD